jgi:non-ribosomal peptide synthetase component E (peptide arylation enzyme)
MNGEHYVVCPDNTDLRMVAGDEAAEEYRAHGWWVDGPFVRADAHRGAVEDRDELAEALERRDVEYAALREDRDRLQALIDAHKGFLRDALNRLTGGQ